MCYASKERRTLKKLLCSLIAFFGLLGGVMAEENSPAEVFEGLRSMVLNLKASDIGITNENYPYPVFAVVMETGFDKGSFTLAAIADGSTSLYYSNGGGIIGGGEHENVRKASGYFISGGNHFYEKAKKTTSFPKPMSGQVIFYFITREGVSSYQAMENDLGNEKDELSELFFAAHNVISELRNIEENTH